MFFHQINSLQELSEVNSYLVKLANITETHLANNRLLVKSLSAAALALCKECVTLGHDLTPCLKVIDTVMELCGADLVDESMICCLSWLMLEGQLNQLGGLMSVGELSTQIQK